MSTKPCAAALAAAFLFAAIATLPACRRGGEVGSGGSTAGLPWTWAGGSNSVNAAPVFGTQGTGAAGNIPGARDSASSWIDAQGNFWLFGGHGIDSSGAALGTRLNDLWEYTPGSTPSGGTWTFVGGSQAGGSAGSYGVQGQAAATNLPPARLGAVSWTDSNGALWLFGGTTGLGNLNDLWKYVPNGVAGEWTWIAGSSSASAPGVYGTLQSSGQGTNVPGARSYASSWVDGSGNLWLFGGQGVDSAGNSGLLNDVWVFDTTHLVWTWMAGSDLANVASVYTASANTPVAPGGRQGATVWSSSSGTVWMFGGLQVNNGLLADLWQLNVTTGAWTFVGGSTTIDTSAVYGTQGAGASTNLPEARASALGWTDGQGRLWIFGGTGWDTTASQTQSAEPVGLSDLWRYDPSTGQWTWVGGPKPGNVGGTYGTLGVEAAANTPGARTSTAAWNNHSGSIWIFGGYGADASGNLGELGDLWMGATP